ncbi:uncharacterized protein LOC134528149 isoform X2 [Bacillus rossius redtenbacheri]
MSWGGNFRPQAPAYFNDFPRQRIVRGLNRSALQSQDKSSTCVAVVTSGSGGWKWGQVFDYGHVGQQSAAFPRPRLPPQVWQQPPKQFGNYEQFRAEEYDDEDEDDDDDDDDDGEMIPLPEDLTRKFGKLTCELCLCTLPSVKQANMHYEGKQHEKRVMRYLEEWSSNTNMKIPKYWLNLVRKRKRSSKLPEGCDDTYCAVCKLVLTSSVVAEQHYSGRSHNSALKLYQRKDTSSGVQSALKSQFMCKICNVVTSSQGHLENHIKGSKHKKVVQRLKEAEYLEMYGDYNEEMEGDTVDYTVVELPSGDVQYECVYCAWRGQPDNFEDHKEKLIHLVAVEEECKRKVDQDDNDDNDTEYTYVLDLFCKLCNVQLTSKQEVAKHVRSRDHVEEMNLRKKQIMLTMEDPDNVTSEEEHKCDLCLMKFPSKSMYDAHLQWKRHVKKVANKKQSECKQRCELCQMDFFSVEMYNGHLKTKRHINSEEWVKKNKGDTNLKILVDAQANKSNTDVAEGNTGNGKDKTDNLKNIVVEKENSDENLATVHAGSEDKIPGGKTLTDKASEDKTVDEKASDGKTIEDKTSDDKTSDSKTSDSKASDSKASDSKASDGKASDGKTSSGKAYDGKASASKTSEDESLGGKASNDKASAITTSEDKCPDGKALNGKASDSKTSVKPREEKPLYECEVCEISVTGKVPYEQHLISTRHILQCSLKQATVSADVIKPEKPNTPNNKGNIPVASSKIHSKSLYCKLCNVSALTKYQQELHFNSKKHKEAVSRQEVLKYEPKLKMSVNPKPIPTLPPKPKPVTSSAHRKQDFYASSQPGNFQHHNSLKQCGNTAGSDTFYRDKLPPSQRSFFTLSDGEMQNMPSHDSAPPYRQPISTAHSLEVPRPFGIGSDVHQSATSSLYSSRAPNTEHQNFAPPVSQAHYFAPPAVAQAHYLAPPTVMQKQYMASSPVSQAQYVAPPSMTQAQYVAPPSMSQAQYVTPPSMSQAQYVAPSSTSQAQYLLPPSTSQAQYLARPSMSQAQYVAPSSTSQAQYLAPPSTSQAQYVAPPSTSQAQYVAPSSTSQAQYEAPRPGTQAQYIESAASSHVTAAPPTQKPQVGWHAAATNHSSDPPPIRRSRYLCKDCSTSFISKVDYEDHLIICKKKEKPEALPRKSSQLNLQDDHYCCEACDVEFTAYRSFLEHKASAGHEANIEYLRAFGRRLRPANKGERRASPEEHQSTNEHKEKGFHNSKSYDCKICDITVFSEQAFNRHLNSTDHMRKPVTFKREIITFKQEILTSPSSDRKLRAERELKRPHDRSPHDPRNARDSQAQRNIADEYSKHSSSAKRFGSPISSDSDSDGMDLLRVKRNRAPYECTVCDETYSSEFDYKNHLQSKKHKKRMCLYECSDCSGVFSSKYDLSNHMCDLGLGNNRSIEEAGSSRWLQNWSAKEEGGRYKDDRQRYAYSGHNSSDEEDIAFPDLDEDFDTGRNLFTSKKRSEGSLLSTFSFKKETYEIMSNSRGRPSFNY